MGVLMRKISLVCSFLTFCVVSLLAIDYVHVEDGHFNYKGERLRLWGVNLQLHHVQNYKGAKITVKRIKSMGFNAIHLWLSRGTFHQPGRDWKSFIKENKGSQKGLDLLDYFIACCKEENIFVSIALSPRGDEITPDVFDLASCDDSLSKDQWFKKFSDCKPKYSISALRYLDERIAKAYELHSAFFLNRINPYTGCRYAEEPTIALYEFADECDFLAWPPRNLKSDDLAGWQIKRKWEIFLKVKYHDTETLKAAWGSLLEGENITDMKAMFYPGREIDKTPSPRIEDAWEFLYGLCSSSDEAFLKSFRSMAQEGKGCNIVPITMDSVIYTKLGNLYAISSKSSFTCGTEMLRGGAIEKNADGYAWTPLSSMSPKEFHYSVSPGLIKIKGKPFCPYAGGELVNNPYRAAAPFFRSIWASYQDWDGVFSYCWGYHRNKLEPNNFGDFCGNSLFPASVDSPNDGYDILNDEVYLSVQKLASQIFLNTSVAKSKDTVLFRFGRKALFSLDAMGYYQSIWPEMAPASFLHSAELSLEPDGPFRMESKTESVPALEYPLKWENGFEWNWKEGFMKLDTPSAKGYAGRCDGPINFKDGISLDAGKEEFIVFMIASCDSAPIDKSRELSMSFVSSSRNSGYEEDFTRLQFTRLNSIDYPKEWSIVKNSGSLPVLVKRPSGIVRIPWNGKVEKYDFAMNLFQEKHFKDSFEQKSDEPVFITKIKRQNFNP